MTAPLLMGMAIYGLFTLTHHGGNRVLTVMSDAGAEAARERITVTDDITEKPRRGYLTQYFGSRKGAFEKLIETNHIVVLTKMQWDQKKSELGPIIY